MSDPVVLSGLRPTGRVHLGNYFGAVKNWVDLQNSGKYLCYFFVADLHALTTDYADTGTLAAYTRDAVLDWLAVEFVRQGWSIKAMHRLMMTSTAYRQSSRDDAERHPRAHATRLPLYFSMITPLGWLERVPTYKDQIEALRSRDLATHGFLGYPVLMTADIAVYRANLVPVGEDQVAARAAGHGALLVSDAGTHTRFGSTTTWRARSVNLSNMLVPPFCDLWMSLVQCLWPERQIGAPK